MNTIDTILKRRSIRKFKKDPIPQEIILELLKASMYAPSAGNEQPWQFIVMDDRKVLDQIPTFSPHASMVTQAPLAILICNDNRLVKYESFWVHDCAAATQNLLLAATEKGLGSLWSGVFPKNDLMDGFRKLLSLPLEIIPVSVIILGYAAETPPTPSRFREDRIHKNHW
jgi:nitroreductase